MKALFVGQSVRVVHVGNPLLFFLHGVETTIIARAPPEYDRSDWLIAHRDSKGRPFGAASLSLEPILPEGLESPAEIDALFAPEQVHA